MYPIVRVVKRIPDGSIWQRYRAYRLPDLHGAARVFLPPGTRWWNPLGGWVTQTGGVLALSSNIGTFSRREWQPFPEFGANWSWQVTPGILMRLGYSFLFLSDIARAHDQVDLSINPSLFPPATAPTDVNRPAFNAVKSSMWIQTINVGVEFTF